jgi:putative endonuclease
MWLWLFGYQILARRWRSAVGEIDLVVQQRQQLVFVEVKWRQFRYKDQLLPAHKPHRLIRAATAFLAQYPEFSRFDCRFDLIIVHRSKFIRCPTLRHVKNIFPDAGMGLDR